MTKVSKGSSKLSSLSNHLASLCTSFQPTIRLLIALFQCRDTAVQFCSPGDRGYHIPALHIDAKGTGLTWLQLLTVAPGRRRGLGPHDLSEREESNILGMITSKKLSSGRG